MKPRLVQATIAACEAERDPALAPILSLLWRFAAEAARTEARAMAQAAAVEPHLPPELAFAPANDERRRARDAASGSIRALAAPAVSAGRAADPSAEPPPLEISRDLIRALDAA